MTEEKLSTRTFELLEKSGLNWSVNNEKLWLRSNGDHGAGEILHETNFYGAVRSDNKDCLGTCTDRYEVFQNSEMMELALNISEHTGYKFLDGKPFGNGGRVMLVLDGGFKTVEYPKVGDVIEKKIELYNSHDGSGSLRIAMGTKVLTCSNGMTRFIKDKKTSVRHTANMRVMVDEALRALELVNEEYDKMFTEIDRMIETEIKDNQLEEVFNGLFSRVMDVNLKDANPADISTRKMNQLNALKQSLIHEISEKGKNAWGVLSGVTHYTTHKAGANAIAREKAKHTGSLLNMDDRAYQYALELVNN